MTVDTLELPAHWASALVNDDYSGLDHCSPDDAARCRKMVEGLTAQGISVVSTTDTEPRFTWHYNLYDIDADCQGGTVQEYVVHIR